jgi:hypothetical protein
LILYLVLKSDCQYFKTLPFQFQERFYSKRLWTYLLNHLFGDHDQLKVGYEYSLSRIDSSYPKLRTDFVVGIKNKKFKFAPPLLFVELSRDMLSGESVGHKDELKLAFTLGAALLKIIGLNWVKDKEFLSKIKVHGILAGATSFDICAIYPVFPNEDKTDFYFVFDCSRSQLRFQILESNKYSPEQRFCMGSCEVINPDPRFQHDPHPTEVNPVSGNYSSPEGLKLNFQDVGIFESDSEDDLYAKNPYNGEINEALVNQNLRQESESSIKDSVDGPDSSTTSPDKSIEEKPIAESASLAPPVTSLKELECHNLFRNGHINERSLQILERLSELVKAQYELLAGMTNTYPKFRYDFSRTDLMISIKSSLTVNGPDKNGMKRGLAASNEDNSPSKLPRQMNSDSRQTNGLRVELEAAEMDALLKTFYNSINTENLNVDYGKGEGINNIMDDKTAPIPAPAITNPSTNMDNESRKPNKKCFIFKNSSKHEIKIYENELIKKSFCFPKYFGFTDNFEDKEDENEIRIELEEIISVYKIDFGQYFESTTLFGAKFLVDIYSALITLHSIGYVHGDVTPGNVGFNEELGIWQLFDFDNARPIEEAALGKGDYHGTKGFKSQNYSNTGKYGPFDDFVGATKTFFDFYLNLHRFVLMLFPDKKNQFYTFTDAFIRRVNPINIESLHRIYFKAVKLLWKTCKKNPKEPSIINAKRILTTPSFIKK